MATQDSQVFHWHYQELNNHEFQVRGRTLFFVIVLFGVVLLITLLFLYARWVCRYHQHHFPTSSLSHAPHASPLRHQGLDPTTIKALPIALYQKSSSLGSTNGTLKESECCICLGVFEDGDKVKVLPLCHHCFHCDCVDQWLNTQSSCPLCRASLRVDSALVSIVTE